MMAVQYAKCVFPHDHITSRYVLLLATGDRFVLYDFSFSPRAFGLLTFKVLVATIDAQWEGMGDVGSARYEPALLLPCPTIRVLSYSN